MRIFSFLSVLVLTVYVAAAPHVHARDINLVGIGVGVSSSEYRSTDPTFLPLPVLNFENRDFYIRGLTAGWKVYNDGTHQLSVDASYLPQHFESSQSDSSAMRQLYDRYPTIMAGASYSVGGAWGVAKLSAAADVLGTSDGIMVTGSYAFPIRIKDLTLTPRAALVWTDANYNDYYYGVSSKEARRSGYRKYSAKDGISPAVGMAVNFSFAQGWSLFLDGNLTFLNNEITDSPMVAHRIKYSGGAGLTYSF